MRWMVFFFLENIEDTVGPLFWLTTLSQGLIGAPWGRDMVFNKLTQIKYP